MRRLFIAFCFAGFTSSFFNKKRKAIVYQIAAISKE